MGVFVEKYGGSLFCEVRHFGPLSKHQANQRHSEYDEFRPV